MDNRKYIGAYLTEAQYEALEAAMQQHDERSAAAAVRAALQLYVEATGGAWPDADAVRWGGAKPVEVDGVWYPSQRAAADALGISPAMMGRKLRKQNT
jgi:hypothetical protein